MTIIYVDEMHCEKCVERIMNAMKEQKVVAKVDLVTKTVKIESCDKCLEKALNILDDLGFEGIVE
ncbi:MAG: heavy metal-associated domain-containing protein [Lachnospiraceae bacterium]